MTHDTDSTARVVVDKSYHWKPIDENTPPERGGELRNLGHRPGVGDALVQAAYF